MSYRAQNEGISLEDRTRRVVAALYRVTDTLSDNEPMKWKLRNDAVELADSIVSIGQKEHVFSENFNYSLLVVERLISKIGIASAGGYISKINFQVLEEECKSISDILLKNMSDMDKGQNILSDISIGQNKECVPLRDMRDVKIERNKAAEKEGITSKKNAPE